MESSTLSEGDFGKHHEPNPPANLGDRGIVESTNPSEGDFGLHQVPNLVRGDPELAVSNLTNQPTRSDGISQALDTAITYEPTDLCLPKDANIPIVSQSQDASISAPRTASPEDDSNSMPVPLDLSKSGLRRSPRIAELEKRTAKQNIEAMEGTRIHTASVGRSATDKDATPPNKSAATSGIVGRFAATTLVIFGLFCSNGHHNFLSKATDSFHRANALSNAPNALNALNALLLDPQVHQRPPVMLRDNHEMPSLTMTDQGSRLLWGNFLVWMGFFGIIVANARDIVIWVAATLLPNFNIHPSTTISLSDTLSITVTYPFIRIVWNRKLRKPPDKSTEQHWILGELSELLSFLLRHNWFGTHSLGEPVICTILQLLSSNVPLQACGGV